MKFRKDINGLRAFAVIAVVLFHFNASWMPGGFAGVDVFFVISGFLMTGIIFTGLENNSFSVLDFYVARANRIIPALAALCLALLIFGWFYLTPLEYKALGKHAASSVGFLSNVIYFTEAGYFDAASHEKWLLHTWSLSVEWQFYIIYPLILLALKRIFSLKTLKSLIIVATVIGFMFSVYATYKWPSASYYLFPMRAWEMMLGGVAFLYPIKLQENNKRLVEILGLVLIVASYIFITGDDPWPGYLALFPVLGTFLVIQAQRNESIITGNIVFQKLGAWSYSIYLWHWPFVVAIYTFSLPDQYIYIGMALSVLLGYLSYKYIERIKFPRSFPTLLSYLKCKPFYIAASIGGLSTLIYFKIDSLSSMRFSDESLLIVMQESQNPREKECNKVQSDISQACTYGNGRVKAIVIGDSHANAQVVAIGKVAAKHKGSILSLAISGCPTIEDVYRVDKNGLNPNFNCGKYISQAIEYSGKHYPGVPVIVINRVSTYLHGRNEDKVISAPDFFVDKTFTSRNKLYFKNMTNHMVNTICKISESHPVYLLKPTPEIEENVPNTMFKHLALKNENIRVKVPYNDFLERQQEAFSMQTLAKNKCGVQILDATNYFCDSDYCYGDRDGKPLYFDSNHLSLFGAELISPIYDKVFY